MVKKFLFIILLLVMASSVYGQTYDFTDGLVSYYPMEDTSYPVLDNAGNNHLEIRSGTPDLDVTGKVGQGIDFESSSSEALANYSQVVSGYPFTLAGWFKPESNGALTGLVDLSDLSSTNINYQITRLATNKPYVYARNGGSDSGCSGGTDMTSANGWRHVVGVFSSDTNRTLYVDGVEICSATDSRTFNSAVDVLTLGAYGDATPAAYFDGVMDEIAIYNRTLNTSEIERLVDCGNNNTKLNTDACNTGNFTAPPPNSISISYPSEGITFQRHNSTTGEIKVVGTYIGNITSIEASFDGSAYTTIDSSPSGNTFTGYFNVSSLTQGNLIVRTNNASVNSTVNNISIGDLYTTGGQSNGDGRGTTLNNLNSTNPFFVFVYKLDDSLTLGDDPTSSQGIAQGSAWVRLANNLTQTQNIPIGLITTTEGSTSIDDWNSANFNDLIQQIREYTNGTMKVKTLLFDQGEEDVVAGELGNYATYKNKLKNMSDQFILQTNIAETVLVRQLGAFTTASRNPLDNIRKAQRDLWIENNNISCGGLSYDIDLGDTVHFKTDSQMEAFSNRWIGAVNSAFYGIDNCRGAILTEVNFDISNTNLTFIFDKNITISDYLGNAGTLARNIWINDSGTILNYTNISKITISNNIAYVNISSPISTGAEIRIGSGNDNYGQDVIRSSDTNLPAEALTYTFDTTPPNSISNLTTDSRGTSWIYWIWDNPVVDFFQAIIYIDDINVQNTTNAYYNATGLSQDTNYTITIHTKDLEGNVNDTDVNNTASTLSAANPIVLTLVQPNNGITVDRDWMYIEYNVTGGVGNLVNCTLYGDNNNPPTTVLQTNNSLDTTSGATVTYNWSSQDYSLKYWKVECTDGATTESSQRSFTTRMRITSLTGSTGEVGWVYFSWTNPTNSEFTTNHYWIDNVYQGTTVNNFFNETGVANGTTVRINVTPTNGVYNGTQSTTTGSTASSPSGWDDCQGFNYPFCTAKYDGTYRACGRNTISRSTCETNGWRILGE